MFATETFYNQKTKVWYGPKENSTFGDDDSIGSIALNALMKNPDHIAQICHQSGRELLNKEIAELSVKAALHFQKLQMKQCDIIGLCAGNSDYVAAIFLGGMMAGLAISTLDPSFDKSGIKHIYSLTQPKIMFCDGEIYYRVCEAFQECGLTSSTIYTVRNHIEGIPNVLEFFESDCKETNFSVAPLKLGPDQVAMILCSSGTTGPPKAVNVSHAALLSNVTWFAMPAVRYLTFSSLYWLSGVSNLLRCTINGGTRIVSENPFTPEDFFEIVKRFKVNMLGGPPSQMALALASNKLAKSDLSSLEIYLCGGSSVSFGLIDKFKRFACNAKFIVLYGMTEVGAAVSNGECEPTNSIGTLMPNMEVTIIDEHGKRLGPNETGEVYIRSKYVWTGYFSNSKASNAIYDAYGWLHSGDLGYFNDKGMLYLVDRKKDILKYNNFHYSPVEIEKVINELAGVAEVCVVGIPDFIHGFLPAAAIIKRTASHLSETEIYDYVAKRMQHFEYLRGGVYFFKSLPQTASGKIVRLKVQKLCENLKNVSQVKNDL